MRSLEDAADSFQGSIDSAPRQIAAAGLAGAIFWADAFTRLGSAIATLYVLVLLMASDRISRTLLVAWSAGCAALTLTAFGIAHGRDANIDAIGRMIVSLGAVAVTTGMLFHRQVMDARVARERQRHEGMLNSLAVAIWEHDFTPVAAAIDAVRASGVSDLRAFLDTNPGFVVATRALVQITDVNETALEMMGVPTKQAFFQRLSDFLPETDESFYDCILAIDERREMFQAETRMITASGEMIDVIVAFSLSPDRCLHSVPGSILDNRQRKRLESTIEGTRKELDKVQRSAAVGAMSASIAHEINQPLSAIQSFSNSAMRWLERDEPDLEEVRSSLDGLRSAVVNVYEVMQRVRNLVGSSRGETAPVNLRSLICDTVSFANRDADTHGAKLIFSHAAHDVVIMGDRILLKHLLLNLITNALQAMEEMRRGEKLIEIDLRADQGEAQITVRDRGPGLAMASAGKQFEPFFTTKPGGMGLGLSICRSIVELHEGNISLSNHPEGGAKVALSLPVGMPCDPNPHETGGASRSG
ncbi:MAG: ATP-binding protein [Novosphingobium aromaticivorans]|nr:ATP-binding protein [Novosphingobium aromaticivorans]